MKIFLSRLWIFPILFFVSDAKEIFLDRVPRGLGNVHLEKSYSMKNGRGINVVQKYALEYPECDACTDRKMSRIINTLAREYLDEYRKSDPKKEVLERVAENDEFCSQSWEEYKRTKLFSLPPGIVTIREDAGGYTGGAHGYFGTEFFNIDLRNGRQLKLQDLFLPESNGTLTGIAERYYRLEKGIVPGVGLSRADEWFEDRFVLSQTFALTRRGILFLYNQYEIKPYASGQTAFVLPYDAVTDLIDPGGVLGFALKNRGISRAFFEDEEAEIRFEARIAGDGSALLKFWIRNLGYRRRGWFSLSFPRLNDASAVKVQSVRGLHVRAYPAGSRIYDARSGRSRPARYLLIEGEDRNWKNDRENFLSMTVRFPPEVRELVVDFRSSFHNGDSGSVFFPKEDEATVKDQQGFPAYRIVLPLNR